MRFRFLLVVLGACLVPPVVGIAADKPAVSLRVSVDAAFSAPFASGQDATLRISPNVIIKNEQRSDLLVWLSGRSRGPWEAVAFARVEVRDALDAPCRVTPLDTRPVESAEAAVIPSGDERPFSLSTEYSVLIPQPGKYRVTVAVAFGPLRAGASQVFVASASAEIEVRSAPPDPSPKNSP